MCNKYSYTSKALWPFYSCPKFAVCFERVQTFFEIVFVVGNSGSGKPSLVYELLKPVVKVDGTCTSGKCDFSSADKHSVLLETVNIFCDDLLLKDEQKKVVLSIKH